MHQMINYVACVVNHDSPDEQRNVEATRSLLIIIPSQPQDQESYDDFHNMVNQYNELPPFAFPNPFMLPKKVSKSFNGHQCIRETLLKALNKCSLYLQMYIYINMVIIYNYKQSMVVNRLNILLEHPLNFYEGGCSMRWG